MIFFVETLDTEYEPFRFLIEDRNRDNRKIKFVLIDAVGIGEETMQGQMSIFDITMPMIRIENKIRLIELFAGYGSQG